MPEPLDPTPTEDDETKIVACSVCGVRDIVVRASWTQRGAMSHEVCVSPPLPPKHVYTLKLTCTRDDHPDEPLFKSAVEAGGNNLAENAVLEALQAGLSSRWDQIVQLASMMEEGMDPEPPVEVIDHMNADFMEIQGQIERASWPPEIETKDQIEEPPT